MQISLQLRTEASQLHARRQQYCKAHSAGIRAPAYISHHQVSGDMGVEASRYRRGSLLLTPCVDTLLFESLQATDSNIHSVEGRRNGINTAQSLLAPSRMWAVLLQAS